MTTSVNGVARPAADPAPESTDYSPPSAQRANVLGVGISAIAPDFASDLIFDALRNQRKGYICVTGVHGVIEALDCPRFRHILNGSFLTTPDGMPMVWAGKWRGHRQMDRVYGPDLMLSVCERGVAEGTTHFLYGGREGVAERLAERLSARFPGLRIVGTYTPPFRQLNPQEREELIQRVDELKPDCFWVGLSTPKQERFMAEYFGQLDTTLMFGVGAAFDFHAGLVRQAPRWMQRSGLEWSFRLCMEPRRLWKRYLVNNSRFVYRMTREAIVHRRGRTQPVPFQIGDLHLCPAESEQPQLAGGNGKLHVSSTTPSGANGGYDSSSSFIAGSTNATNGLGESAATESTTSVSVVVPMFNEFDVIEQLEDLLEETRIRLADRLDLEFILVDDGSTDGTGQRLAEWVASKPNYRLVSHHENRGIAAAITTGLREASHELAASIDSDGTYDPILLGDMVRLVQQGCDLVTASPYHPQGGVLNVPPWRVGLSRTASAFYRRLSSQKLSCYTSCFRVYRRSVALTAEPRDPGFVGLAEMLLRMQQQGAVVAEFPATLRSRRAGHSKMRAGRVATAHLKFMLRTAASNVRQVPSRRRRRLIQPTSQLNASPSSRERRGDDCFESFQRP